MKTEFASVSPSSQAAVDASGDVFQFPSEETHQSDASTSVPIHARRRPTDESEESGFMIGESNQAAANLKPCIRDGEEETEFGEESGRASQFTIGESSKERSIGFEQWLTLNLGRVPSTSHT